MGNRAGSTPASRTTMLCRTIQVDGFHKKITCLGESGMRRKDMYAIVETGGKQYRVTKGDIIQVEKLEKEKGKITLDKVLLIKNKRSQPRRVITLFKSNFGYRIFVSSRLGRTLGNCRQNRL